MYKNTGIQKYRPFCTVFVLQTSQNSVFFPKRKTVGLSVKAHTKQATDLATCLRGPFTNDIMIMYFGVGEDRLLRYEKAVFTITGSARRKADAQAS